MNEFSKNLEFFNAQLQPIADNFAKNMSNMKKSQSLLKISLFVVGNMQKNERKKICSTNLVGLCQFLSLQQILTSFQIYQFAQSHHDIVRIPTTR